MASAAGWKHWFFLLALLILLNIVLDFVLRRKYGIVICMVMGLKLGAIIKKKVTQTGYCVRKIKKAKYS